ncbi:MAG: hypothetical protein ACO1SX_26950 [Actinomycetota bacterium]
MDTITVEVSLPDELRARFEARVREYGGDQRSYVRDLLEQDLRTRRPDPEMSFGQLLSMASGPTPADELTDEDLTAFVEAEVKTARSDRRERRD